MAEEDVNFREQAGTSAPNDKDGGPWLRGRPILGVVTGAVALLLGVVLAVVLIGPEVPGRARLMAPTGRPDPVPTVPAITKIPMNCGVTAATVRRLVSAYREMAKHVCSWSSSKPCAGSRCLLPGLRSELDVALYVSKDAGDAIDDFMLLDSPDSQYRRDSVDTPRTVRGLGDDASTYYYTVRSSYPRGQHGALIIFRAANVVGTVGYRGNQGRDLHHAREIPQRFAVDGALRAAADVAESLGATARPTVVDAASTTTPPIRDVPKPCGTVPSGVLDLLTPKASRTDGDDRSIGLLSTTGTHTCGWESTQGRWNRQLSVSMAPAPDWRPGVGTLTAAREYLRLHYDARAAGTGFKALTEPSRQAFCVYDVKQGRVVFRVRNVLVEVDYSGSRGDIDIPAQQAINGAYTAAVQVAKAIAG